MSLELFYQACQIYKMHPRWKFASIVDQLNKSQFTANPYQEVFNSNTRKKRKISEERQEDRKKICSTSPNTILVPDKESSDKVIVISSDESTDTDTDTEVSAAEDDAHNTSIRDNIQSIFPECAPLYLEFLITLTRQSIANDNSIIDHIVNRLISENYPTVNSAPPGLILPPVCPVIELSDEDAAPVLVKTEPQSGLTANGDFDLVKFVNDEELFDDSFDDFMDVYSELEALHTKEQQSLDPPADKMVIPETSGETLVLKLLPIFPDACPQYLRKLCKGRQDNPTELEELITDLIQKGFPKRAPSFDQSPEIELNEERQYQIMLELLPDADPTYLRVMCSNLYNKPDELKLFVDNAIEKKDYPTLKDYKRKQQLSAQMKQYTNEFDVHKFLELIPNPDEYFNNPNRVCTYANPTVADSQKAMAIHAHMKDVFKNIFVNIRIQDINQAIAQNKNQVIPTYKKLKQHKHLMKRPRKPMPFEQLYGDIDVPYLQEIAYITHREEIKAVLEWRKHEKLQKFQKAKSVNELVECGCCYDDEIMLEDTLTCDDGHVFCRPCIRRSVEIAFGENKIHFVCMAECNAEFSLATLQKILKPNMFSKIALRKQIEEVKSAGIDDLESCPFCDFATIPTPGDKIFRCLNEECMKESCRQCKEPSHIPYRCDEIENNDEVKARTYIEDKMTEALVRKCYKCGMKFIKEDGCNKMTCQCGALMCYICGQPVDGYKHFNGQGGTNYELCPLYSDTEKLHIDTVRRVGNQAKQEIQEKNPEVQLKYDPLTGLPQSRKKDKVYQPGAAYNPFADPRMFRNDNADHQHHHHHHHHHPHYPHYRQGFNNGGRRRPRDDGAPRRDAMLLGLFPDFANFHRRFERFDF